MEKVLQVKAVLDPLVNPMGLTLLSLKILLYSWNNQTPK